MATTRKQIGYGSQGSEVKELQTLLNKNGANLTVDGIYGKNTREAVRKYQRENGLAVDGIVGNNTWGSLLGGGSSSASPSTDFSLGGINFSGQDTMNAVMNKIFNREDFSYDLNGDALYQQYKDKFIQQGKMASQDVMGQAAAMTGGYGNSFAATVGNQAYQQSLQDLNDVIPELYQMAYDRHAQEGQDLYDQYMLLANERSAEYDAQRDIETDNQSEANQAYVKAITLINAGVTPSDDVLAAAGLTKEEAEALIKSGAGADGNTGSNSNFKDILDATNYFEDYLKRFGEEETVALLESEIGKSISEEWAAMIAISLGLDKYLNS